MAYHWLGAKLAGQCASVKRVVRGTTNSYMLLRSRISGRIVRPLMLLILLTHRTGVAGNS